MPIRRSSNSSGSAAYEVVQEFPSQSKPGKFYQVKRKVATGELSCNCPAWIFSGRNRACDHVRAVQRGDPGTRAAARPETPAPRSQRVARPPSGEYYSVGAVGGFEIWRNDALAPPRCYFCGCAEFQRERMCRHVERAAAFRLGEAERERRLEREREERVRAEREAAAARERAEWNARAQRDLIGASREDEVVNQGLDWILRRREGEDPLTLSYSCVRSGWIPQVTVERGAYYCTCEAFREFGACPHVRAQSDTDAAFRRAGAGVDSLDSTVEPQTEAARVPLGRCAHCGDAVFEDEVEREVDGAVYVFHRRHLGKECFRFDVQFRDYRRSDGESEDAERTVIVVRSAADEETGTNGWRKNRQRGGIAFVSEEWDD